MTNAHAYFEAREHVEPALTRIFAALGSLRAAAADLSIHLLAGLQHRWTMHQISRFSDHRLQDLGFERDWDGSVLPARRNGDGHRGL
jgi:hypothetical protein